MNEHESAILQAAAVIYAAMSEEIDHREAINSAVNSAYDLLAQIELREARRK